MSLFSKLRGSRSNSDGAERIAKAIFTITMMLVSSRTDKTDDSSLKSAIGLFEFSPIFRPLGPETVHRFLEEHVNDARTRDADDMVQESIDALSPELRETALCFAFRVALADGHIEESEEQMLELIGERMDIPREPFMKIYEVMSIMQRSIDASAEG